MLLRLLMAKMSSQEWSNPREISVNCPGIESDISDGLVSTSLIKLRSAWSSTRVSPSFLSQAHQRHVTYRMCLTTWDWCPLRNISKRARIVTRRQQDTIFMDFRSLCFLRRRVSRASWEGWFEATALEMPAAGAQLLPIFWPFDWQYICVYNNISYIKHTFILFILFYITFIRFYTVSMCAYSEFVALLMPFFLWFCWIRRQLGGLGTAAGIPAKAIGTTSTRRVPDRIFYDFLPWAGLYSAANPAHPCTTLDFE